MRLRAHLSTAPWYRRALTYVVGLVLIAALSWLIAGLLSNVFCSDGAVDCDLDGLVTAGVAVMAVAGYLIGVVLFELLLAVRRLRRGDRAA